MHDALLAPVGLHALDDLKALLPQAVHLHQLLRRMLQVAVDDRHAVSPGLAQTGKDRRLLAEIAGKMHAAHGRDRRGRLLNSLPGGVFGAVVHKQQLVVDALCRQNLMDGPGRDRHHFLLVIGRKHYRQHGEHLQHFPLFYFHFPGLSTFCVVLPPEL